MPKFHKKSKKSFGKRRFRKSSFIKKRKGLSFKKGIKKSKLKSFKKAYSDEDVIFRSFLY